LPAVLKALEAALLEQGFWSDRASGIGVLSAASALAWSASGPVLRASGIGADVRLDIPYCDYAADSFLAPVGECGDAWDRCRIRVREMAQSAELVAARLRVLPGGDWRLTDEKIAPAPLPGLRDAEAMIHHFGAWMYGHGLQPPEGKTAFVSVEAPAGELACFVASDGSDRPCRLHFRSPSLLHLQLFPRLVEGLSLEQTALVWGSLGISAAEADR
jgi:NADH-quinone oxidoreductase subunit D